MTTKNFREDRRPADLWFWSDWFSSFDVRSCCLAAQGLWVNMLGIMSRAEIKGTLTVNGKPLTSKELAKIVSAFSDEVERLLIELEFYEVFSRLENGTIYNRRMKKEGDLSRIRAESGRLGGLKQSLSKSDNDVVSKTEATSDSEDDNEDLVISSVLLYLNEKADSKFSLKSDANRKHISARIAGEGRTLDDFKAVIDKKVSQWKGQTWPDTRPGRVGKIVSGNNYLRPSTLFRPENFENYLNESATPAKVKKTLRVLQRDGSYEEVEVEE